MRGKIEFKYLPVEQSIIVEANTPKYLAKKVKRILGDKPFESEVLIIGRDKIRLVMPIRVKYKIELLPDNAKDIEFLLLYSDELIDYLNSMYKGVVKGLENIETELYYLGKYIKKLKNKLKLFENIEELKEQVGSDTYYYLTSLMKSYNLQLAYFTQQKKELTKSNEILYLILDVIHYLITQIVANYPLINIDFIEDKFVVNVYGTSITLRSQHYRDVREIIEKNKDYLKQALIKYKSDIMDDINKTKNESIQNEKVLSNYQKILEDLEKSGVKERRSTLN